MNLSALGAGSGGLWTRHEALQVATPGQVRRLLRAGTWQSPWPGVYTDAGHVLDAEQRAYAAVLCGGGPVRMGEDGRRHLRAAACARTAARVHGLLLVDDDDPLTGAAEHLHDEIVCWSHGRTLVSASSGRVLHRRRLLMADGDVVRKPGGLWLTSRLRTVLDCAALLSHEAFVCLVDDVLHRELLSRAQLEQAVTDRRRLRGGVALARGVVAADGRAESPAETLARLLLLPHVPGLVPQVELHDRAARLLARFDLADEQRKLAVELDGRRGHAGDAMVAKDQRRDRRTRELGWRTERGTWLDVRCRPDEFVQRVLLRAGRPHAA